MLCGLFHSSSSSSRIRVSQGALLLLLVFWLFISRFGFCFLLFFVALFSLLLIHPLGNDGNRGPETRSGLAREADCGL